MPTYKPSDTVTDVQTVAYVRQNCHQVNADIVGGVKRSGVIHVPYAHTKQDVIDYKQDKDTFMKWCNGSQFINVATELPDGSLVLIPDGKKGLIVRLKSGVKTGYVKSFAVASNPRECGHPYNLGGQRCKGCYDSIKEVFDPSDVKKMSTHLLNGCLIEPFEALYREVEVVGDADYNGVNGSSLAGPNSAGKWSRYWALV